MAAKRTLGCRILVPALLPPSRWAFRSIWNNIVSCWHQEITNTGDSFDFAAISFTQIGFIVHDTIQLHAVQEAHVVGSTSGTLMLRNCTTGQAAAAGLAMLTGTIDLSTGVSANTPQSGVLHGTAANLQVAAGSMVQLEIASTMTGLSGACVTLTFKRI